MIPTRNFPPESPGLIEATGSDAVRFLNGQLTQNVRSLGQLTRLSCITDAKGKLQHLVEVLAGPAEGSIWVACRPDESAAVLERLDRYLIADDVALVDLTGSWHRQRTTSPASGAAIVRHASWPGSDWFDVWTRESPSSADILLSDDEIEEMRVLAGVPQWGAELVPGMLPPEAGLDTTAVSFNKGCYIGQETLSRIKSAGKLNRRLTLFAVEGQVAAGDALAADGETCGEVTSVAPSGTHALGYLRKSAFDRDQFEIASSPGTVLRAKQKA